MKQVFEGHSTASHFAQTESMKTKSEKHVIFTRAGGIKYFVVNGDYQPKEVEKVLEKYLSGNIVK